MNTKQRICICRYHLFLLLVFLNHVSCSNSPQNQTTESKKVDQKDAVSRKIPCSFSDTLAIFQTAVVFYYPDSLQLEKTRWASNKGVYEANVHEFFYLMRNARMAITKNYPLLRIIEAKNVRYLLFVKADKSRTCIDLDTKYDLYGLFAFDSKKTPQLLDLANIDTELGFYYSQ